MGGGAGAWGVALDPVAGRGRGAAGGGGEVGRGGVPEARGGGGGVWGDEDAFAEGLFAKGSLLRPCGGPLWSSSPMACGFCSPCFLLRGATRRFTRQAPTLVTESRTPGSLGLGPCLALARSRASRASGCWGRRPGKRGYPAGTEEQETAFCCRICKTWRVSPVDTPWLSV